MDFGRATGAVPVLALDNYVGRYWLLSHRSWAARGTFAGLGRAITFCPYGSCGRGVGQSWQIKGMYVNGNGVEFSRHVNQPQQLAMMVGCERAMAKRAGGIGAGWSLFRGMLL